MLAPAWKLPAIIIAVAALAVVLLPGTTPAPLLSGVFVAVAAAVVLYAVLLRRERSSQA